MVLEASLRFPDGPCMSYSSVFFFAGGASPPGPPKILDTFFLFLRKLCFFINRAADSTMFQISKNAASWWSSFVCSLSVALFRDVPRF